MVLRDT